MTWSAERDRIKAVEAHDHPVLGRTPEDFADLDGRILQMGGNDLEIVPVEGDEFEKVHGNVQKAGLEAR